MKTDDGASDATVLRPATPIGTSGRGIPYLRFTDTHEGR